MGIKLLHQSEAFSEALIQTLNKSACEAAGVRTFHPHRGKVLILLEKTESQSAGGIFIPDAAKKTEQWGMVIAVGEGVQTLQHGLRVFTAKHDGHHYVERGMDLLITDERKVLAFES